ncbi:PLASMODESMATA CALLOSE-BINDING PROTEIN 5-like [Neltuma alba]|uniref:PLASMODESMATA CALLOSE-BINDING PROTEIN 5-like n=1 Tax=Neltuma alba TaxID=207710 RepID=UPI0010A48A80|nr:PLASMODESMATA CALLOSE-BINDING PROTEIN 5-like [Prosopis alba]
MLQIFAFSLPFFLFLIAVPAFSPPFSYANVSQSLKAQVDGVPRQELWCVAKNNAEDTALQAALDWACGNGGADCGPIQQGGPCYDPSSVQNTASYAFNDYFLKHGLSDESCNFNNNAAITSLNPSHDSCKFPSSLTVSNGSISGTTSSSMGQGPSEAISGCSEVFWGSERSFDVNEGTAEFFLLPVT